MIAWAENERRERAQAARVHAARGGQRVYPVGYDRSVYKADRIGL